MTSIPSFQHTGRGRNGSPPPLSGVLRSRQLLLLLLPSLLAVCAGAAFTFFHERHFLFQHETLLAEHVKDHVEEYIADAYNELRQLAESYEGFPPEVPGARLRSEILLTPQFRKISWIDSNGSVIVTLPPSDGQPAALNDINLRNTTLPSISPETGEPVVFITHLLDTGESLIGELSLPALTASIATNLSGPSHERIIITDRYGNLVSHPDLSLVRSRENLGDLDILRMTRVHGAQSGLFLLDGTYHFGTTIRMDSPDWLLLIIRPLWTVAAPIATLLLILVAGLFLFFSFVLSRTRRELEQSIVSPLAVFSRSIKAIASGDYRRILSLDKPFRELEVLEQAFNHTVHAVDTRRKKLEASEARYRSLFDNAVEGIFQLDMSGHVMRVNPAMARILGYHTPEELLRRLPRVTPKLFARSTEFHAVRRSLLKDGALVSRQFKILHRNGGDLWLSANVRVNRGATGEATIEGIAQDVTRRMESLQEAEWLRRLLMDIISSMPSVLIGVDDSLSVILWNAKAEEETGLAVDDALSISLTQAFPDLAGREKHIRRAIALQQSFHDPRIARTSSALERYMSLDVYPFPDEKRPGAVLRIDDVTERIHLEQMMVQTEKTLSIGGLVAGMAHEINNPLAAIMGNAQVLHSRLSGAVARDKVLALEAGTSLDRIVRYTQQRGVLDMLNAIIELSRRVSRIVSSMLGFSRVDRTALVSHDLARLVEETLSLALTDMSLKKEHDIAGVQVERRFPDQAVRPACDPGMLQQVIFNLIKNSIQAMSDQPDPDARPRRLILRVFQENGMACLSVEDNGPGVPESLRENIFKPFFTTKPPGLGTGLGLSVSAFIIRDQHNGELEIDSSEHGGARFTVRLPLASPPAPFPH